MSYCKQLMPRKASNRIDKIFKGGISKDLRQILKNMLNFNPYERLTAKELLNNNYFAKIRNLEQEKGADFTVKLTIDDQLTYDYDALVDENSIEKYM